MPMLKLTDEQADQLIEWHERILANHACVGANEGLACCIDKLLIPNYVARGWDVAQIARKTELTHEYVKAFVDQLVQEPK
jgi:hypothetical protein